MKDQAMHLCLTEQLEADPAASLIAAQHREDHSRNLLLLRFRVTLPLAVAERFREAAAIPPIQGQSRLSGAESGAESQAEGSLAGVVLQALGRDSVSGALNRTIRQLLDRDEIGYTLPDTPNSRLQKYRRRSQPRR